jgi:NAD(P)-dependent dehydrogenase (short-subunit alcohol dehydrogenase family)
MPRFEPHPKRRTAAVAGASSGIGAALSWRQASPTRLGGTTRPDRTTTREHSPHHAPLRR